MIDYRRMPIEIESPEEMGYEHITINLAESSAVEWHVQDLSMDFGHLKLEYTSHRGYQPLRSLIASEGKELNPEDVLLTGGAAMAMFIIYTALLKQKDTLAVLFPNYASNIKVPEAMGVHVHKLTLTIENEWKLDLNKVHDAIRMGCSMISLTTPHNPTGMVLDEALITELVNISNAHQVVFVFDETYRDACFAADRPILASYHPSWISVLSFSKGYGMPGIRLGAIITKNKVWMDIFLAAKEMIQICNPPIEEYLAYQFFNQKAGLLPKMHQKASVNLSILTDWATKQAMIQMVPPQGGLVAFLKMLLPEEKSTLFYTLLFGRYKTILAPGHWFDCSDQYMRLGFGYPDAEKLKLGLAYISELLAELSER